MKTDIADIQWMELALHQAKLAATHGEVPVGAVVVRDNILLAKAGNAPIATLDPTAHAEILAIRRACKKTGNYRLPRATLYVTLEPCIMCAGAIIHTRIERLVFGVTDPKSGAVVSVYTFGNDTLLNHSLTVEGGLLADRCKMLLQEFFQARRQ